MYHELVKVLRETDFSDGCPCGAEPLCEGKDCVILQAADASEELQAQLMYSNDAAKAIAEKVPKWIPVTERFPEKDQTVLAYCAEDNFCYISGRHSFEEYDVTHWIPLPQMPKDGES